MLNRRTIRIKIMQSLFAYHQCKEADLLLAHDMIEQRFSPDLNSMEVQDKEKLRRQKSQGIKLLEKKVIDPTAKNEDEEVNKAVADALTHYHKLIKKDQVFLGKNIIVEVEKLSALYHSVLGLMVALAEQAAHDKKGNAKNFTQHPWIVSWQHNPELQKSWTQEQSGWSGRLDLVRSWYREVLKEDDTYQKFLEQEHVDEEAQKSFIKHLSRKLILGATIINDYFDENNIRWAEDKEIVRSMVDKTIKSFADGKTTLQKLSLNWDEDREFIDLLFNAAVELEPQYHELIARNTRNWEVDRLPLTDRVILEMAIAEMIHFPNIPVKVTINEYIELTKEYSTPKSRQFINGILDVISKTMKETGAMKKSGRGLLDNK